MEPEGFFGTLIREGWQAVVERHDDAVPSPESQLLVVREKAEELFAIHYRKKHVLLIGRPTI